MFEEEIMLHVKTVEDIEDFNKRFLFYDLIMDNKGNIKVIDIYLFPSYLYLSFKNMYENYGIYDNPLSK